VYDDVPENMAEPVEPAGRRTVSRRNALKGAAAVTAAATTFEMVSKLAFKPARAGAAADITPSAITPNLPDIQFNIGPFLGGGSHAVQTINGVQVQFGPVFTGFTTLALRRTPTTADQTAWANALNQLENSFAFTPAGLMTFVSYGIPYFRKISAISAAAANVVNAAIPKLSSNTSRSVLEEAVPSPTDVSSANPGISKQRFNVPVRIEANDVLLTFRSDNSNHLNDAFNWLFARSNTLNGRPVPSPNFSSLFTVTSNRGMFQQNGLPRSVANNNNLPFAKFVNPQSPMWLGFADQQTNAAGPAAICTFAGNASAHITTARSGDYFDNGGIQHLSHNILDMKQWFDQEDGSTAGGDDGVFTERVQYMFHSPQISAGNTDQFTDGGGPAFLPNQNKGPNYARQTAAGVGTEDNDHRIGHLSTLQRSSRAADGTPMHIRMDGAGYDAMDVPGGGNQPKLQFTVFVPTSDFFTTMRRNQASIDLVQQFAIPDEDNGLERFITATRRQNFLVPPRRHRAFPLREMV
jgi:hypothetical protein